MARYLELIVKSDNDLTRGDATVIPAGSWVAYHLQYPSLTEAMAHVVYANRFVGRVVSIVRSEEPAAQACDARKHFVLPAYDVAIDPVAWIKSGWGPQVRNYKSIVRQLGQLHLRRLPDWPERSRNDARNYWQSKAICATTIQ